MDLAPARRHLSGSLLDRIPDAAVEIDATGALLGANERATELLGCSYAELPALVPLEQLAGGGDRVRLEARRSNGVPVVLDAAVRWSDDAGEPRAVCSLRQLESDRLLAEAQLYFDVAFDSAPIGMALFNCDGEYVRVNDALCGLLGRDRSELIGRRDQELTHPDDRQADVDAAWDVLSGKLSTHQCEKRFVRPDGSVRWTLANLTFLRDERKRALGWVGQFQDISARRAAEDAVRESAERHRLVVQNLPGGVVLYDADLRCVLIEGRHMDDADVDADALVGRPMSEILPAELRERVEPLARRALLGEPAQLEVDSPVSRRTVLADVVPHRAADGRIVGVLIGVRDVTEQRAAEVARQDAEERFQLAFDHAPIGIALVDPEGRWLRVNRSLSEMIGYSAEELLKCSFQDITHPDDLDADLDSVRRMLAGEIRTYEMEKRYIRSDGSVVWVLLSVSLVRASDGTPRYFISQLQDIDERKRRESELEHHAGHDALTGVANRRTWDVELARAIAAAQTSGRPLAIALLDLNGFKAVNDTHGHQAGDALLVRAAAAWQTQLRSTDILARVGGDEFGALLVDCDDADLRTIAQRLRDALPHAGGCSIGIARFSPTDDANALMLRADAALYSDKAAGARPAPRVA